MADAPKQLSVIELTPVPRESWLRRAGVMFRSILKRVSDFSRDEAHTGEIATDVVRKLPQLGSTALEGLATEKHAKAEADYATAELSRIEVQLRAGTLESQVRISKEEAEKAAWETRSARADAFMKELQLLQFMEEHKISLHFEGPNVVRFRKVQGDDPRLVDKLISEDDRKLLLGLGEHEEH